MVARARDRRSVSAPFRVARRWSVHHALLALRAARQGRSIVNRNYPPWLSFSQGGIPTRRHLRLHKPQVQCR